MSVLLERCISVKQTTMAATALPLELQQQVFSFLDAKSFYSARKVCKWWHFASTDAVPLARQLRKLPILPPAEATDSNPTEIRSLFDEAARTLMLGVRVERAHDRPGTLSKASKLGFPTHPRVQATANGDKTVTLNGRTLALFDTSGKQPEVVAQRPLNDLKEAVGSGPWLKVQPHTHHELALSSDGTLLAVAQERTIQIYDLLAEPDSFTVNEYVSSATGHYICGLEFEQNDHVLRVRLSGKGTVLYLGSPPKIKSSERKATMDHWKSKGGLKHTFLDSALLRLSSASADKSDEAARISGVQLLRPFEDGWLIGAQRHGSGESSYYVLCHVRTTLAAVGASMAMPGTAIVLARLESFLSSWKHTVSAAAGESLGLWENMPSAHEHHPKYCLSEAGDFLALAERDKKRIRPAPLTQLFVYRLPTQCELRKALNESESEREHERYDAFLAEDVGVQAQAQAQASGSVIAPAQGPKYRVPRIPLCISTLVNEVTDFTFSTIDETTSAISAATQDSTRTWLLQDL